MTNIYQDDEVGLTGYTGSFATNVRLGQNFFWTILRRGHEFFCAEFVKGSRLFSTGLVTGLWLFFSAKKSIQLYPDKYWSLPKPWLHHNLFSSLCLIIFIIFIIIIRVHLITLFKNEKITLLWKKPALNYFENQIRAIWLEIGNHFENPRWIRRFVKLEDILIWRHLKAQAHAFFS